MRDEGGAGRREFHGRPAAGPGALVSARCDECQSPKVSRRKTKVARGPLRGLMGMVCQSCLDLRLPPPEESDSEGGDTDVTTEAAA